MLKDGPIYEGRNVVSNNKGNHDVGKDAWDKGNFVSPTNKTAHSTLEPNGELQKTQVNDDNFVGPVCERLEKENVVESIDDCGSGVAGREDGINEPVEDSGPNNSLQVDLSTGKWGPQEKMAPVGLIRFFNANADNVRRLEGECSGLSKNKKGVKTKKQQKKQNSKSEGVNQGVTVGVVNARNMISSLGDFEAARGHVISRKSPNSGLSIS